MENDLGVNDREGFLCHGNLFRLNPVIDKYYLKKLKPGILSTS